MHFETSRLAYFSCHLGSASSILVFYCYFNGVRDGLRYCTCRICVLHPLLQSCTILSISFSVFTFSHSLLSLGFIALSRLPIRVLCAFLALQTYTHIILPSWLYSALVVGGSISSTVQYIQPCKDMLSRHKTPSYSDVCCYDCLFCFQPRARCAHR